LEVPGDFEERKKEFNAGQAGFPLSDLIFDSMTSRINISCLAFRTLSNPANADIPGSGVAIGRDANTLFTPRARDL
jgi:hypothetical protein